MPRCSRLVRVLALALVLVGCGGSRVGSVHVRGGVDLLQPHADRLRAASRALEASVGHPVDIEIDAALASGQGEGFGLDIAREIEKLAQALAAQRRPGDPVFEELMRDLERITVSYVPLGARSGFEARGLAIRRVDAASRWDASALVLDEYFRRCEARFAGRDPATVPPSEHEVYARWLYHEARSLRDGARRARVVPALLRFEPALAPSGTKTLARQALLYAMADVLIETPSSTFAPIPVDPSAVRAFAEWATANVSTMTADDLTLLMKRVGQSPPLPGLDPVTLIGFAIEAWGRAGRPLFRTGEELGAMSQLPPLLPVVLSPGRLPDEPTFTFYALIAGDQPTLERLSQRLDAPKDPVLRALVLSHLAGATCDSINSGEASCARVKRVFCRVPPPPLPPGHYPPGFPARAPCS